MSNVKTAAKSSKNFWNEENGATAVTMYTNMVNNPEQGLEYANTAGLVEIMTELEAPSIVAVRSKLVSAKAYQKSDKPRKVGGTSALRKAHYVRVMAKHAKEQGLIENEDDMASLELPKLESLEILAKMLGISDEVKESVNE